MRALANGLFLGPLVAPSSCSRSGSTRWRASLGLVGSTLGSRARPYDAGAALCRSECRRIASPRSIRAWRWPRAGLAPGPWRVFRTVTLPSILPGIVGRRRLRLRHLVRRGRARGLPGRSQRQDAAGAHLGGSARRIHADRRGRRDDHDRARPPRLGRGAVGDTEGDMSARRLSRHREALRRLRGARSARSRNRLGRIHQFPRPLGLRQDDAPQHLRWPYGADGRLAVRRRPRHHRAACAAAQYRHGVPELCAVPASRRVRERRLRAAGAQGRRGGIGAAGRGSAAERAARRLRPPLGAQPVRRPAAARGAGSGAW